MDKRPSSTAHQEKVIMGTGKDPIDLNNVFVEMTVSMITASAYVVILIMITHAVLNHNHNLE